MSNDATDAHWKEKKEKILTKHKHAYPENSKLLRGQKVLSLLCSRNFSIADLRLFTNELISVMGPGVLLTGIVEETILL